MIASGRRPQCQDDKKPPDNLEKNSKRHPLNSNAGLHVVNALTFRGRRKLLGWSQAELGQRSGYSERVIRKAEAGGTLRLQTIQDLASAMSVNGHSVSFLDLTIDLESIAKRFIESYDSQGCHMLQSCGDIFADDFAFTCPADPTQVSFAGVWRGVSGFQEFLNRFFGTFTRRNWILKPVYMVSKERVVARFEDQVYFQGSEIPAFWVNLHFHFRKGLVTRIDDEFDCLSVSQSLKRLRGL